MKGKWRGRRRRGKKSGEHVVGGATIEGWEKQEEDEDEKQGEKNQAKKEAKKRKKNQNTSQEEEEEETERTGEEEVTGERKSVWQTWPEVKDIWFFAICQLPF